MAKTRRSSGHKKKGTMKRHGRKGTRKMRGGDNTGITHYSGAAIRTIKNQLNNGKVTISEIDDTDIEGINEMIKYLSKKSIISSFKNLTSSGLDRQETIKKLESLRNNKSLTLEANKVKPFIARLNTILKSGK